MASDPEIVAIELIGNVDRFKRDTKTSADEFGKQMDRIEKDGKRAEDSLRKVGVQAGEALSANDNKAAKQLDEVAMSAKDAEAQTARLQRVAEAARRAFERIPEVKIARQLAPETFEPAREQFVDQVLQQERVNIAEGLPEATDALNNFGKAGAGAGISLGRLAGLAGAAAGALFVIAEGARQAFEAFQESERNLAKLNAQLIATGNLSLATGDQIAQFADQVSEATLQAETSTQSAAATLARVPNLTADALEEALLVSAQFADAMQGDVADVIGDIVGPAFTALADDDIEALYDALEGLNPTLARTVIELADAGRTADAQSALLAGLREAAGDGPDGLTTAADQLSERWKNAKEELGEDIAAVTVPILEAIVDVVDVAQQRADQLRLSWGDLALVLASPITGTINIVRRFFSGDGDGAPADQADNGTTRPGNFAGRFLQRQQQQQAAADRAALQARFNRDPERRGRRGGGGRSAEDELERARQEELRRVQAFQRRLQGAQDEILRGQTALAEGVQELRELQLRAIEVARSRTRAEIDADLEAGRLRREEADQLIALNEERAKLLAEAVNRAAEERALKERLQAQRQAFESEERGIGIDASFESEQRIVQADILQGQLELARTQKERRDLEQRLLDLQFEEERARNDYLIGYAQRLETQEGITESELAIARAAAAEAELRNASLDLRRAQAGEASNRATAGPLESFFQGLPQGADELNEALESVAANGIASVTDGLVAVAVNFQSLEQTALSVLQSITAALVRLAIQQLIVKSLGASLGFSEGGPVPGFSGGGPVQRLSGGGLVIGPGGPTSDDVPALGPNGPIRLSNREFVIKAASVQSVGIDNLAEINRTGRLPGFALGGAIGGPSARAAGRASGSMAALDDQSINRLAAIVSQAAAQMPEVNLFPTVDPAEALRASLGSSGGGQVFFDFLQANAGRAKAAIGA